MIDKEHRAKRINEIPLKIKELKKEHRRCVAKNWIVPAARLRKQIEDLEQEFTDLYNSYRQGE